MSGQIAGVTRRCRCLESGQFRHIEHDLLLLDPPDDAELDRAYAALRRLHGDAFGWSPPDVAGLERLGATRMRQYVWAWINEWDLIRLDPAYVPYTEAVEIASDYRKTRLWTTRTPEARAGSLRERASADRGAQ